MAPDRPLNAPELIAALDWYRAAGVDLGVNETPTDRFAAAQMAPAPVASRAAPTKSPIPPNPPLSAPAIAGETGAVLNADPSETQALAAGASSLEELAAIMDAYDGCVLKKRATRLVFADGNPQADIMLVGEGPGREEDRVGKPFVGPAGQLLDKMLGAIGLDREKVYIANMVPWQPPGNRDPSPEELALCAPFLYRQIELVGPKLLITLGRVPSQYIFETRTTIGRLRGQWQDLTINSLALKGMASWHPAYLLRTPAAKEQSWRDLISLKQMIEKITVPGE